MTAHNDFYRTFCKPQFEAIDEKLSALVDVLKGKDGEPGLCDHVRAMREENVKKSKQKNWLTRTFIGAVIVQILFVVREFINKLTEL